jgi:hypothetical protein
MAVTLVNIKCTRAEMPSDETKVNIHAHPCIYMVLHTYTLLDYVSKCRLHSNLSAMVSIMMHQVACTCPFIIKNGTISLAANFIKTHSNIIPQTTLNSPKQCFPFRFSDNFLSWKCVLPVPVSLIYHPTKMKWRYTLRNFSLCKFLHFPVTLLLRRKYSPQHPALRHHQCKWRHRVRRWLSSGLLRPYDGRSTYLWNVGKLLTDH